MVLSHSRDSTFVAAKLTLQSTFLSCGLPHFHGVVPGLGGEEEGECHCMQRTGCSHSCSCPCQWYWQCQFSSRWYGLVHTQCRSLELLFVPCVTVGNSLNWISFPFCARQRDCIGWSLRSRHALKYPWSISLKWCIIRIPWIAGTQQKGKYLYIN